MYEFKLCKNKNHIETSSVYKIIYRIRTWNKQLLVINDTKNDTKNYKIDNYDVIL